MLESVVRKKMFAEVHLKKKSLQRKIFHTPPPPPPLFQENNGPSLILLKVEGNAQRLTQGYNA